MYDNSSQNKSIAIIKYKDGDFEIISLGEYVICAISGEHIPLNKLCYWNVDRQVPYANAELSLKAEQLSGNITYRCKK
ncbi:MAG: DUF2093 domain-containing protein [Candidatus Liberibacter europaeus]|uniref:DUF2093 domain-containing protein n=1 Tax=Candidatus Liberibacter europaeus TaxID=744859 RepID=A0A2T4VXP9_9HYPH|nr:DUF2093 domain-containing protein [Candidatus Liberibacter europaeus]PTL86555.1 MAG: DUF2093 domain-containing protein [Candidatus Liberibacter europaeus]